jgi:hypothetical protein
MCGKRAEDPIPKPREMPTTGGFSLPHLELYDDTQRLLEQMRNAIRAAEERSATLRASGDEIRAPLALPGLEAQMYSRAIQVFASMAAEAALNAYGLMWFGETDFERHFRQKKPVENKLKALIRAVLGRELSNDDETVRLLVSLRSLNPAGDGRGNDARNWLPSGAGLRYAPRWPGRQRQARHRRITGAEWYQPV